MCSCRRHGLTCMTACGPCHGNKCLIMTRVNNNEDSHDKINGEDTDMDGNIFENLYIIIQFGFFSGFQPFPKECMSKNEGLSTSLSACY